MKVLVTGAGGQLGSAIVEEFTPHASVAAFGRSALDVTSSHDVRETVSRLQPDVVINCAAYTNVDGAETEAMTALEVNSLGVRTLARAASQVGATFVHYSTDFVFDGTMARPYEETDAVNPRSTYAASKLIGEWFACEPSRHYVLRVESLFGGPAVTGSSRRSSVDRIYDALKEGRAAPAIVDRTVSPSYVIDVARVTRSIVTGVVPSGVYHCVNTGSCTWYELAEEVRRMTQASGTVQPIRMDELTLAAARPKYAALSNVKLANHGVHMPTWQDALRRYIAARSHARP